MGKESPVGREGLWVGVVARGQGKQKRRKGVHGRMGEYGCPSCDQSGSERWAESSGEQVLCCVPGGSRTRLFRGSIVLLLR